MIFSFLASLRGDLGFAAGMALLRIAELACSAG
jgi:hypothetical protein